MLLRDNLMLKYCSVTLFTLNNLCFKHKGWATRSPYQRMLKLKLLLNETSGFQLKCFALQYFRMHSHSTDSLPFTFVVEGTVFLVACLAFLASLAALLIIFIARTIMNKLTAISPTHPDRTLSKVKQVLLR